MDRIYLYIFNSEYFGKKIETESKLNFFLKIESKSNQEEKPQSSHHYFVCVYIPFRVMPW